MASRPKSGTFRHLSLPDSPFLLPSCAYPSSTIPATRCPNTRRPTPPASTCGPTCPTAPLPCAPRSGLAVKHGIGIVNSPGTIDADYRGEVRVLLVNLSNENFVVNDGERIAQLVVAKHETINWQPAETLSETERGSGGYGSTGQA